MIEVSELRKSYGAVEALRGVSFNIAAGQIVGLLGPNGAGKTTIIKILTGYLQPDAGTVTVDGLDVLTQTRAVQARIGYLPENAPLYPELSVQAYLKMMADLRQIPAAEQLACYRRGGAGDGPARLPDAAHRPALQGLPAARGAGAGYPAQAEAADPR
jgi:ABC-2 type transport system ATP-binding protein